MGIARRILLLIPDLALVHAMTIQETAVVKSLELWRTYWKNEWILPPMNQQKWMEVSVGINRKNSVDDAISYEQRVGQKSCDELLLARKQWEFPYNLNVRWSSRVPKSSRQENGDRWSPKKTEKSHRSWWRSSSGWSKENRRKTEKRRWKSQPFWS